VQKHGGIIGDIIPVGALPLDLYQTGDLYYISEYFYIIEALRALSLNINIELYITTHENINIIDKKSVIENGFKLNLNTHSMALKDAVYQYYHNTHHHTSAFKMHNHCTFNPVNQPIHIDHRTILHINDYIKDQKKTTFFKQALKQSAVIRDIDIARQHTNFDLNDDMRLALTTSKSTYHLPTHQGKSPNQIGKFVLHYKNIALSFINHHNEVDYIYFNHNSTNTANPNADLYHFIEIYLNKVPEIMVKSPLLIALPQQNPNIYMMRGIIYNNQILPMGILRQAQKNYSNIILQPQYDHYHIYHHSCDALKMLSECVAVLKNKFPLYYYGIDYYIVNNTIKISGIKALKTHDLGLIASYYHQNSHIVDRYILQNKQDIQKYNVSTNMMDTIIGAQLRDLMLHYTRAQFTRQSRSC
jgi:hypothetical protein